MAIVRGPHPAWQRPAAGVGAGDGAEARAGSRGQSPAPDKPAKLLSDVLSADAADWCLTSVVAKGILGGKGQRRSRRPFPWGVPSVVAGNLHSRPNN